MELHLHDLVYSGSVILEGEWNLPFAVGPVKETTLLTLDSARIPARNHGPEKNGEQALLEIREIRVSATDIRFVQTAEDQMLYPDPISLVLRDGTEAGTDGGGSRWTGTEEWSGVWYWKLPVDLFQAEALRFGDMIIPLK